jgi:hypothetical protein
MVVKTDNDDKDTQTPPDPFPDCYDDPIEEYMAERAYVEAHVSDDDRMFDTDYIYYAHGTSTIQALYNPHEFDDNTRIRFMKWIQRQLDAINTEDEGSDALEVEYFWDDCFYRYHNVRQMYNDWKLEI